MARRVSPATSTRIAAEPQQPATKISTRWPMGFKVSCSFSDAFRFPPGLLILIVIFPGVCSMSRIHSSVGKVESISPSITKASPPVCGKACAPPGGGSAIARSGPDNSLSARGARARARAVRCQHGLDLIQFSLSLGLA